MAKASKKSKTNASSIQDIPHEDVVQDPKPVQTSKILELPAEEILELTIKREIARFNLADAAIAQLKAEYEGLTILGPEDKTGYDTVKRAWNNVRSVRTDLEKKGKEIRADYNRINKAVSAEEDRLIDLVSPLEQDLQKKWKDIDAQVEAEERRKEQEEQDRLMARIGKLTNLGMKLVEGYYTLGPGIAMDVATLRAFTEDQFTKFLAAVEAAATDLADKARLEQERQQREKDEQFAEQERLRKQHDDLLKEADRLKAEQDELRQQKEELQNQRRAVRQGRLAALGYTAGEDGQFFYRDELGYYAILLAEYDVQVGEQEFEIFMTWAKQELDKRRQTLQEHLAKKEEEAKLLRERTAAIHKSMAAAGLSFNYERSVFLFTTPYSELEFSLDELLAKNNAEIEYVSLQASADVVNMKQYQMRRDKEKAEEAEQLRLGSLDDDARLKVYLTKIKEVERPANFKVANNEIRFKKYYDMLINLLDQWQVNNNPGGKP